MTPSNGHTQNNTRNGNSAVDEDKNGSSDAESQGSQGKGKPQKDYTLCWPKVQSDLSINTFPAYRKIDCEQQVFT